MNIKLNQETQGLDTGHCTDCPRRGQCGTHWLKTGKPLCDAVKTLMDEAPSDHGREFRQDDEDLTELIAHQVQQGIRKVGSVWKQVQHLDQPKGLKIDKERNDLQRFMLVHSGELGHRERVFAFATLLGGDPETIQRVFHWSEGAYRRVRARVLKKISENLSHKNRDVRHVLRKANRIETSGG